MRGRCDAARSAFDEALGDLNPLACPSGSTNTVWEHLVYTGTTNGAFAHPQSTERTAVLRVTVTGAGRGELLVGSRAVPLVGERSATLNTEGMEGRRHGEFVEGVGGEPNSITSGISSESTPCLSSSIPSVFSDSNTQPPNIPCLLLPVPRGQTVPLYLRASGTLAVSFSSADFAFGRLPDLAAHRPTGRINFPNVSATVPCFHDYRARQREVTLPVGADAAALACTWKASDSVTVENVPPRSARLTGRFDGRETPPVSYALAHPDYLFGQTAYAQTARFCPPPPEEDEEDPSAGRHYGSRDGDEDDEDDPCWHCVWGLCGEGCDCCPRCHCGEEQGSERPGGASEEEEPQPGDYEAACTNWPHLSGVLKIREPLLFAPPIRLEVPDADAPRCCPCPEHATNWVAVAYQSDRLKAVDADGLDFRRAAETVDVRLAGARPSRDVGDAFVSFATNGAVCLDGAYTVLGVGVRRPGVDLAALDSLNADFGLPVPVATNAAEAAALELVTAVGLDGGNVRVGFEEASAPFALWAWDSSTATCRKLASSDGGPLDVSLAAWRRLVGGATDAATSRTAVSVTASAPGAATLVFRYWGVFNGRFVEDVARQRLTAIEPLLLPDYDSDNAVGDGDLRARVDGRLFRFWTNEDCDKGDYVGQMSDRRPNVEPDVSLANVKGRLDLVNLFPVRLDASPLVAAYGKAVDVKIRAAGANLRYCLVNVPPARVGDVYRADVSTTSGEPLHAARLYGLPAEWTGLGELGAEPQSVFAFEAVASVDCWTSPEVSVSVGGQEVYRERLPCSIDSVRKMYWWYNGRHLSGQSERRATCDGVPPNNPDVVHAVRRLVFLHGANVSEADAGKWGDALFKRLWLSGARVDFCNVDWRSDIGSPANYHENASNAFAVAASLAPILEGIPGEKVVMAHSLGNMVVSSMIQEHGLVVSRYLMCNSAVPAEAYDAGPSLRAPQLVHPEWEEYPANSWAANWHRLFAADPGDDRRRLGWPGLFPKALPVAVNFYSTGDEVLELAPDNDVGVLTGVLGSLSHHSWHKQELFKGRGIGVGAGATDWSGWNVEEDWRGVAKVSVAEARRMSDADFRTNTVFRCHPASMDEPAIPLPVRAAHLALGIPALTPAAGATAFGGELLSAEMIDMNDDSSRGIARPNGWPYRAKYPGRWLHSDMKDAAYYFVYKLFEQLIEKGELR